MTFLILLIGSLLAAVIPMVVCALIIWWFDRYEKEPRSLLIVAFLWGAGPALVLAVIAELLIGAPVDFLGPVGKLLGTIAVAPIVEEVTKAIMLFALMLSLRAEFDDVLDGIIYGALVGFGFGMAENFLYNLGQIGEGWAAWAIVAILRATVSGQGHALYTCLTGAGFGMARLSTSRAGKSLWPLGGLTAAIICHSLFNLGVELKSLSCFTFLLSALLDWGGILVIFVVMLLAGRQEKRWLVQELAEETQRGLITEGEYVMACSYRKRMAAQFDAFTRGAWARRSRLSQFTQLLTELAFKKHQTRALAEDHSKEIDDLRGKITRLRATL